MQYLFFFFFLLEKFVNSKGFFSCGIETKVRHMFNSHKQLKQKSVAIRNVEGEMFVETPHICHYKTVTDCDQRHGTMPNILHNGFYLLTVGLDDYHNIFEIKPPSLTAISCFMKRALHGLFVLRRWIPSILIWEGMPNKDWSKHIHRTLHATWKP